MPLMLKLFPDAIVTVNESNVHLFKDVVPSKQLLPHPDLRLIETRNWILDNIQEDCVIQFNDDVKKLVWICQKSKTIRDPKIIQGVIENTMQCAADLDLGVFCWSLTSNGGMLHPDVQPIRASAPVSAHAFGILGRARERRLDTQFRGCGDFDFTLRSLLVDRAILCDVRWHFDCGGMSRGKGGQTGEIKPEHFDKAQKHLRQKWGQYVGKSKQKQASGKQTWRDFSVNVKRKSPLGVQ
jgi:hypothetical protein